jgi:CheY-like chemotaxis protein
MICHTKIVDAEHDVLDASLEDALANLFDLTYLASHEVGRALSSDAVPLSPEAIHRALVEAIRSLRPPLGSPATSATWRRYRYLELRYLTGESHKAVAAELGLSVRQAHRVRTNAIEVVRGLLREDRGDGSRRAGLRSPRSITREGDPAQVMDTRATFENELTRLGREAISSLSDLTHELREVAQTIDPLARLRGVTLSVDVPDGNWLVAVDPALLRQSILLLIAYALDQQRDGRVRVSVDSQPNGIAVDIIFSHGDTVEMSTSPEDSRLSTSRWLVESQGGTLDLMTGDRHSGLHLWLCAGKTATVLTIDDNPELGRLFEHYLQGTRYQVKRAKTGQTALRLAEQTEVDVITLDVMMPFQDGWEVFRRLRENALTSRIPVIVCSILPEKDLAFAVGATDFLAKPVNRRALIMALDRCCPTGLTGSRALA